MDTQTKIIRWMIGGFLVGGSLALVMTIIRLIVVGEP